MHGVSTWREIEVPDDSLVTDLWVAPFASAAVTASIEIGLFARLAESQVTAQEIAMNLKLHAASVDSVLRVLVAMQFVIEVNSSYALTPVAQAYLTHDA